MRAYAVNIADTPISLKYSDSTHIKTSKTHFSSILGDTNFELLLHMHFLCIRFCIPKFSQVCKHTQHKQQPSDILVSPLFAKSKQIKPIPKANTNKIFYVKYCMFSMKMHGTHKSCSLHIKV